MPLKDTFESRKGIVQPRRWLHAGSNAPVASLHQGHRNLAVAISHLHERHSEVPQALCQILSRGILESVDEYEADIREADPFNRHAPLPPEDAANQPKQRRQQTPSIGLATKRLSEFTSTLVDWAWLQRIPLGSLTLINGDPGIGKTWLVLEFASLLTTGRGMPDGPNPFDTPVDVLWISAEDDEGTTIKPRLEILGADTSRVHSLQHVRDEGREASLDLGRHLEHLDQYLAEHPLVKAVIFDPLTAYLGKVDSHKNSDTRALLSPLSKLLAKHQVAGVGINHLNKGGGDKAMYRGMGSIAFVAASRSSWLVSEDPQDATRRLFTKIKCNLQTEDVGGLAFRVGPLVPGVFAWDDEVIRTTADESLREPPREKTGARDSAKKFLRECLAGGPMLAADIFELAKSEGHTQSTLKKAKDELGIIGKKTGGAGTPWQWELPTAP